MKAVESKKFKTVDEYLDSLSPEVKTFKALRKTVKQAAPKAEETISYNMPTLKLNGSLIHFAAWKKHISIYPITAGLKKALKKELAPHIASKGTLKFPLDEPLPHDLITRIVEIRVQENLAKAAAKKAR